MFQARVASSSPCSCTIETVIDGKRLSGVIFPTKTGGDDHARSVYFAFSYPVVENRTYKWLVDGQYRATFVIDI